MTNGPKSSELRDRMYAAYSSTHAGVADAESESLSFRRDVLPHLPTDRTSTIVDLGCGQGQLVKQLLQAGYRNATGIDISPEQVQLAHAAGIDQVMLGDYRNGFGGARPDAVVATDFFEHLDKYEVLEALDHVHRGLAERGVVIARVPNSGSPFVGNIRYGDITHETSFTARSIRQIGAAAGFVDVSIFPCNPIVHGARSLARRAAWTVASGAMKLTLIAETGQLHSHVVTQNLVAVLRKR